MDDDIPIEQFDDDFTANGFLTLCLLAFVVAMFRLLLL